MSERYPVWPWFLLALLLGALPRLAGLGDQILLDDEWHGLNFVIGKSAWEVLSEFHPSDHSSPPYNLYRWFLYEGVGWSEWRLRLPALLAGLGAVILLPWRVVEIVGRRAALLFAFLLAVSPFLVFYSRFSRAYGLVALLSFLALFSFLAWLRTGRPREAVLTAASGILAVWMHPAAIVVAGVPIATAWIWMLFQSRSKPPAPGPRALLLLGATVAILSALPLLPLFLRAGELPLGQSSLTPGAIGESLLMLAGTAAWWLAAIVVALSICGLVVLSRSHPLFGTILVASGLAQLLALMVAAPKGSDTAIVVLRYSIWVVPLALLLAAVGLDRAAAVLESRRRGAGIALPAACVILLVGMGPLLRNYSGPNNFAGHSAYQGSYAPLSWERSDARHVYPGPEIAADEVSPFYRQLAGEPGIRGVVEYPFDTANYNNRLYYYQHFHGKPVLAGYTRRGDLQGHALDRATQERTPGSVGNLLVDRILSRVEEPERLRFKNMVEVTDLEALRASGADLLVLHKTQSALHIRDGGYGSIDIAFLGVARMVAALKEAGERPLYEDAELAVFRISEL